MLHLLQNNLLLPWCQHYALWTSFVVSLAHSLFYLACSLTSSFHISCTQATGKNTADHLIRTQVWENGCGLLRDLKSSTSGTFWPNANSKLSTENSRRCHWSLELLCFLVTSFCFAMVDEVFHSPCSWLLCYLTSPIYWFPTSFQCLGLFGCFHPHLELLCSLYELYHKHSGSW